MTKIYTCCPGTGIDWSPDETPISTFDKAMAKAKKHFKYYPLCYIYEYTLTDGDYVETDKKLIKKHDEATTVKNWDDEERLFNEKVKECKKILLDGIYEEVMKSLGLSDEEKSEVER